MAKKFFAFIVLIFCSLISMGNNIEISNSDLDPIIQKWIKYDSAVILIEEIKHENFNFNKPRFYREESDGSTKLIVGQIKYSINCSYKDGTLVFFETRCDFPEKEIDKKYKSWILQISPTCPATSLTHDSSVIYYCGENATFVSGDFFIKFAQLYKGDWKKMADAIKQ